ncbi:MAG: hypothetical protein LBF68_02285 [Christensenellaceae bacterium]|jgi:hypothetical protein|nr:hypothetical protein [Christensenellaceae bacterium]
MSILRKHYKKIVCIILVFTLCFGFIISSIFNGENSEISMNVRAIDVDQLSYF